MDVDLLKATWNGMEMDVDSYADPHMDFVAWIRTLGISDGSLLITIFSLMGIISREYVLTLLFRYSSSSFVCYICGYPEGVAGRGKHRGTRSLASTVNLRKSASV
jgi:hypothetical protein